ncbi:MAG: DUF1573 domain-containing protein [Muribaculaceae bacterium]|nr:DUF1573 domain-containing protein [Muribaculaceae bacterium]
MKRLYVLIPTLLLYLISNAEVDIKWLETEHNFGAFDEETGPVTAEFKIVNTGNEPVEILAARASCGCTTPKYPRTPIAPGDTAVVAVTYDPAGRPGQFTKYVGVDLSAGLESIKLYIKGTVVGSRESVKHRFPVSADQWLSLSRNAVMFGQLKKGMTRTFNLHGYNLSGNTLHPTITNLPEYISVDVVPEETAPGDQVTFILYFNSAKCPDYGLVADTLLVSSDPLSSTVYQLPVTALVSEDFGKMSPQQLAKAPVAVLDKDKIDFGKIDRSGKALKDKVSLKNEGKSQLVVRRVYSTDPGVKVSVSKPIVKPGKTVDINIELDPSQIPGDILNYRVALVCNDPANPTQTIRLVGE